MIFRFWKNAAKCGSDKFTRGCLQGIFLSLSRSSVGTHSGTLRNPFNRSPSTCFPNSSPRVRYSKRLGKARGFGTGRWRVRQAFPRRSVGTRRQIDGTGANRMRSGSKGRAFDLPALVLGGENHPILRFQVSGFRVETFLVLANQVEYPITGPVISVVPNGIWRIPAGQPPAINCRAIVCRP